MQWILEEMEDCGSQQKGLVWLLPSHGEIASDSCRNGHTNSHTGPCSHVRAVQQDCKQKGTAAD